MTEAVTQCSYCSQSAGDDVAAFHEVHIQPATKPKLDGMVKEILKEAAKHTRQQGIFGTLFVLLKFLCDAMT